MNLGIGQKIKERRLELGLTQLELAQKMGYKSRAAICKVEKGEDNITSDRITRFAKALECSESYIMGKEEPKNTGAFAGNVMDFNVRIAEDKQLLDRYHNLSPEDRNSVDTLIEVYLQKRGLLD